MAAPSAPGTPMSAIAARKARAQALPTPPPAPVVVHDTGLDSEIDIGSSSSSSAEDGVPDRRAPPPRRQQKKKAPARYYQEEQKRQGKSKSSTPMSPVIIPDEVPTSEDEEFDFLAPSEGESSSRPRKRRRTNEGYSQFRSITSLFTPKEGCNICRISSEAMYTAVTTSEFGGGVRSGKAVVISLSAEENLIISGTATITPLLGSITPFSTPLDPSQSSLPLFAPLTHPLPVIRPSPTSGNPPSSSLPLEQNRFWESLGLPEEMTSQGRTVFMLQENVTGLEGISEALGKGYGKIWPDGKSAFGLAGCYPIIGAQESPIYPYTPISSWASALEALPTRPPTQVEDMEEEEEDRAGSVVVLVKGGKGSGKSTFLREVVNGLLGRYERVAYLDCDLGQSEFSPGGSVELHVVDTPLLGPAYTHPTLPLRAHHLSALHPRLQPVPYLASITSLLEHYRFEVQYPTDPRSRGNKVGEVVPLVVNTMGWVKGIGEELGREIEGLVGATHTVSVIPEEGGSESGGEFQGVDYSIRDSVGEVEEYGVQLEITPAPASPLQSKFSASDMRTLSLLSYFHARFPGSGTDGGSTTAYRWDFSSSLVRMKPYEVDMEVFSEIYLTGEGAEDVGVEELGLALNGSIVGLLGRPESLSLAPSAAYIPGRFLPSPTETEHLGLALIRALSPDDTSLLLLTPLPAAMFSRVVGLVRGELELPVPAYLDWQGEGEGGEIPFLMAGGGGVGMGRRRWRRNVQRRGQGN